MHRLPNRHADKMRRARQALNQAQQLWALAPVHRSNEPHSDSAEPATRAAPGAPLDQAGDRTEQLEHQHDEHGKPAQLETHRAT